MNWLLSDWRQLLPEPWASIALVVAAVVCGAIVGSEREKREKPAGLRTLVLVCLGSALFTMVSFAFGTTTGDTGRVAAQIVTGVGFLGAGVIMHGRTAVSGLTTAATIWATAATGMVVGVGRVGAALGLSIGIRTILSGIYLWEYHLTSELHATVIEILVDPKCGKTRIRVKRLLEDYHVRNCNVDVIPVSGGQTRVRLSLKLPQRQRLELLDELARLAEVHEIAEITTQSLAGTPM
jgi:putative Mg2+ transporter-C (MgtC) family protein